MTSHRYKKSSGLAACGYHHIVFREQASVQVSSICYWFRAKIKLVEEVVQYDYIIINP